MKIVKSAAFFSADSEHRKGTFRDSGAPIFVLPVVLRYEKGEHMTSLNVFKAAAQHMSNVMSDPQVHSPTTKWGKSWREWEAQQFRKVVRRAKPGQFTKLESEPDAILTEHVTESGATIKILSLTPYLLESTDRRLKNFQVSGLSLPHELPEPSDDPGTAPTMLLSPNYALGASTGKMIAQVCHAVQLMIYSSEASLLKEWEKGGRKILFSEEYSGDRPLSTVSVVDAGFTELPANSTTVKGAWLNSGKV